MDVWLQDQQKALLSVALDHDMKSLLLECAFTWFRGGIQHCFFFVLLFACCFFCLLVCLLVLWFAGGDTCFSVFVEWLRGTIKDLKIEKEHLCECVCVCVCVV